MRIGLDVRMIDNSGIGRTIQVLLKNLTPHQLAQLTLFGSEGWANPYPCEFVSVPYRIYSLVQHWSYARLLNRYHLDFFHMPHYDIPLTYRRPFVATVHDLTHVLFPEHSTKPLSGLYSRLVLRHVARRAAKIIVVSENTRRDLVRYFPDAAEKTALVYNGIDAALRPAPDGQVLDRYKLSAGYLLYVGNLRGSKNTPRLLEAYEQLRQRHPNSPPLVLIGANTYRRYDTGGFPDGVRYLGPVPQEHLSALYSGAALFVFPSLYEGFGLPPLEAMACGVPVVASMAASIPEVCGEAAEYVDPSSTSSMIEGIRKVLQSSSRQEELRKKGFQNVQRFKESEAAANTWKIYEEVAEGLAAC